MRRVDPAYFVDNEGECLAGISKWESKEAFLAPSPWNHLGVADN
jgi:hypothetical protein